MIAEPTPAQFGTLRALVELTRSKGYPPTLPELSAVTGDRSRQGIHEKLGHLADLGLVTESGKVSGKHRSRRPTAEGYAYYDDRVLRPCAADAPGRWPSRLIARSGILCRVDVDLRKTG